jgi:hypothetical protein
MRLLSRGYLLSHHRRNIIRCLFALRRWNILDVDGPSDPLRQRMRAWKVFAGGSVGVLVVLGWAVRAGRWLFRLLCVPPRPLRKQHGHRRVLPVPSWLVLCGDRPHCCVRGVRCGQSLTRWCWVVQPMPRGDVFRGRVLYHLRPGPVRALHWHGMSSVRCGDVRSRLGALGPVRGHVRCWKVFGWWLTVVFPM